MQATLYLMLCEVKGYCSFCRRDVHELILDADTDVLMLTETRLYPQGDESNIAAMTPAGHDFHSFPH